MTRFCPSRRRRTEVGTDPKKDQDPDLDQGPKFDLDPKAPDPFW